MNLDQLDDKKDLPKITVRLHTIATILGMTENAVILAVRNLGMPKIARGSYPLLDCVNWYIEYLMRSGNIDESDIHEERKKLIVSQRQRVDLDNAQKRGELIDAESVGEVLNRVASITSTLIDGLSPRVSSKVSNMTDAKEIQQYLFRECRDVRFNISSEIQAFGADYAGLENHLSTTKPRRGRVGGSKQSTTTRKPRTRKVEH